MRDSESVCRKCYHVTHTVNGAWCRKLGRWVEYATEHPCLTNRANKTKDK